MIWSFTPKPNANKRRNGCSVPRFREESGWWEWFVPFSLPWPGYFSRHWSISNSPLWPWDTRATTIIPQPQQQRHRRRCCLQCRCVPTRIWIVVEPMRTCGGSFGIIHFRWNPMSATPTLVRVKNERRTFCDPFPASRAVPLTFPTGNPPTLCTHC